MPATTADKKLPYPLGNDRVMDGDDQIRKLAQSVDNMVQAGTVGVPITTGGTSGQIVVTFPVAYSAPPFVNVTYRASSASSASSVSCDQPTTTSVPINGVRASSGTLNVMWTAVGPVVAVA